MMGISGQEREAENIFKEIMAEIAWTLKSLIYTHINLSKPQV
jgi:hypothetical protein